MSKLFLPLCSVPKLAIRDGLVGATARLLLPFYTYGYWFASGQQYTFPSGSARQDQSLTVGGTAKPDTYQKNLGVCLHP